MLGGIGIHVLEHERGLGRRCKILAGLQALVPPSQPGGRGVRVVYNPRTIDPLEGWVMDGGVFHSPHSGNTVGDGIHPFEEQALADGKGQCGSW